MQRWVGERGWRPTGVVMFQFGMLGHPPLDGPRYPSLGLSLDIFGKMRFSSSMRAILPLLCVYCLWPYELVAKPSAVIFDVSVGRLGLCVSALSFRGVLRYSRRRVLRI